MFLFLEYFHLSMCDCVGCALKLIFIRRQVHMRNCTRCGGGAYSNSFWPADRADAAGAERTETGDTRRFLLDSERLTSHSFETFSCLCLILIG